MGLRKCSYCKREKPTADYTLSPRSVDGIGTYCSSCRENERERYRRSHRFRGVRWPFVDWEDRLLNNIVYGDGCWEWAGWKTNMGYGGFWQGRSRRAHIVVYEFFVGPVPDGLVLDHLCCNPGCVRVDHLEPVTQGENMRRYQRRRKELTLDLPGSVYKPERAA